MNDNKDSEVAFEPVGAPPEEPNPSFYIIDALLNSFHFNYLILSSDRRPIFEDFRGGSRE